MHQQMKNTLQFTWLTLICLGFLSCGRIQNSSSSDKFTYSPGQMAGSAEFLAAAAIIGSKCSECHGTYTTYTEADYIAAGLVVAKDLASSSIYFRNQSATVGAGPHDMPKQGRTPMTAVELQTLADWINSIN